MINITENELNKVRLKKGDILMVEGHGNPEEIGRSAIWDGSIEDCVHQNHLIRVRLQKEFFEPEFINHFLNSEGGRTQLFSFGKTTSGLNTINISNVRNTKVLLPPIDLQRKFVNIIEKIKVIQEKAEKSETGIENLFNSLMQQAFSGELKLSEYELMSV